MKFDITVFNSLLKAPQYEGVDGYLIDDNKEQIPYHVYMCIVETQTCAAIIVKKMPVTEESNYEIYEFNGNKLLDHKVVRIKALDANTDKYKRLVSKFENKEFVFQN